MGNGNVRKAKTSNNTKETEQPAQSSSSAEPAEAEHRMIIDNSERAKVLIDLEDETSLHVSASDQTFAEAPHPSELPSAPPPVVLYPPGQQNFPGQPQTVYPGQNYPGGPQTSYIQSQPAVYQQAPMPEAVPGGQPWPPPAPVQPATPQPQIPLGYNILDALQHGNVIQLICKVTNKPLTNVKGATNANGVFGKLNSTFTVIVPKGAAQGVIMLHNTVATGLYLSVNKAGFFHAGQGRKWSHLQPIVQPDNSVSFKSVEWGGLVCFNRKGLPFKAESQQDPGSQFHIRIEKQMNLNSQQITTPFGRPSIANQLRTDCLVQLFLKNFNLYNQYLSVDQAGAIVYGADGNDTATCFKLLDRGMGRFSFQSQKFKTLQLSMINNVLNAKSGVSGNAVDFQLKENVDGTASFESINCPGAFICINNGGTIEIGLNVAVVIITGIGRNTTVNKTYLN